MHLPDHGREKGGVVHWCAEFERGAIRGVATCIDTVNVRVLR
jgi:hypothetical protein